MTTIRRRFLAPIILGLLAALAPLGTSRADVLYSTFGPGDSFDTAVGWTVSGLNSFVGGQSIAMKFTVSGSTNYTFTSAELAMFHVTGTTALDVALMSDAGGLPGSVLETITINTPNTASIVTAASVLHPVLQAGATYWLAGLPGTSDNWSAWNKSSPAVSGSFAYASGSGSQFGPWTSTSDTLGAFRINAQAVPEPQTLGLVALGGLALVARRTRRRGAR